MISGNSPYTMGEATAIIAAIADADIEDLADWAIVAMKRDRTPPDHQQRRGHQHRDPAPRRRDRPHRQGRT